MKSKITSLSKNAEFKSLLSGKKISNKYSSIYFKRLNGKSSNRLNISFVAKKKLGNAVIRNKIKRRLRHIMRDAINKISLNLNYSYLIIAKNTVLKDEYNGSRDRSWGVRPVGLPDSQMLPPLQIPQFYWLWAPANFDNCTSHLYFVDDLLGNPTHSHCVIQKNAKANILNNLKKEILYREGTRRIKEAKFTAEKQDGSEISWILKPKYHIYMCGLGYMHPEWGHGHFKGENQSTYDSYDLNEDCLLYTSDAADE